MNPNMSNYKFYLIQDDFESSNPINNKSIKQKEQEQEQQQYQNIKINFGIQQDKIDKYNYYANYENYENYYMNTNTDTNTNTNTNTNNNTIIGNYNENHRYNYTNSLNQPDTLKEKLIGDSMDLVYVTYLRGIIIITTGMFFGVVSVCWLISFIMWINKSSSIGFFIYGLVIIFMVGIMLTKVELELNIHQNIHQNNHQNNYKKNINQINLDNIYKELPIEKKIIFVLISIGLSCLISPIVYLLNNISYSIPLSMLSNLVVGGLYIIKKLGEIKHSDSKKLYKEQIPLDMIKIITISTLVTGLFELILNIGLSDFSMVKIFILTIITNLILFYIYWCQIKLNIYDSEESYSNNNIDLFNCVLNQPIKITKYIKKIITEHFVHSH